MRFAVCPVFRGGVSIGTFQYEGSDITHWSIENADGKEIKISYKRRDALLQANETQPLYPPDNRFQLEEIWVDKNVYICSR